MNYSLKLRKKRLVFKTALESLDTQILYNGTFTTFAIKDLRDDERIEYVSGKHLF
jgi:uncharacterized protein (DUF1015 family)